MPFGRRRFSPAPTLFQLQDQWDDARRQARIAALRRQIAATQHQDRRWLPFALTCAALILITCAALTP